MLSTDYLNPRLSLESGKKVLFPNMCSLPERAFHHLSDKLHGRSPEGLAQSEGLPSASVSVLFAILISRAQLPYPPKHIALPLLSVLVSSIRQSSSPSSKIKQEKGRLRNQPAAMYHHPAPLRGAFIIDGLFWWCLTEPQCGHVANLRGPSFVFLGRASSNSGFQKAPSARILTKQTKDFYVGK